MKSILQTEKSCYITGSTRCLELHHIYPGNGLRKISDNNGFVVWLHHNIHAMVQQSPDTGVDLYMRRQCQRKYEETHSREDFIKLIGRNYLDD